MGDEADALEGQSDEGAERDCREHDRERAQENRRFKNAIRQEVARQLRANGMRAEYVRRGTTATYQCKTCQRDFTARVADRKRGWAKFCSKSCKATFQDIRTGGENRGCYGQ